MVHHMYNGISIVALVETKMIMYVNYYILEIEVKDIFYIVILFLIKHKDTYIVSLIMLSQTILQHKGPAANKHLDLNCL
jgi:hypothetical protein